MPVGRSAMLVSVQCPLQSAVMKYVCMKYFGWNLNLDIKLQFLKIQKPVNYVLSSTKYLNGNTRQRCLRYGLPKININRHRGPRDHPYITSYWVGLEKWQFLLTFSSIYADVGWVVGYTVGRIITKE